MFVMSVVVHNHYIIDSDLIWQIISGYNHPPNEKSTNMLRKCFKGYNFSHQSLSHQLSTYAWCILQAQSEDCIFPMPKLPPLAIAVSLLALGCWRLLVDNMTIIILFYNDRVYKYFI